MYKKNKKNPTTYDSSGVILDKCLHYKSTVEKKYKNKFAQHARLKNVVHKIEKHEIDNILFQKVNNDKQILTM